MSKEMLSREEFVKELTNNEKISSFRSFLESTQIKHNLSTRTNEELVNNLADIMYLPLSPVKLSSYTGLHDLLNNVWLWISLMNMIKDISDSAFSVVQKFRETNKNLLDKVIQDNTSKLLFDVFVVIDESQVPVNEALNQLNTGLSSQLPQVVENNIITTDTINMKEVIEKPTQIIVEDLSTEGIVDDRINKKQIKNLNKRDIKEFIWKGEYLQQFLLQINDKFNVWDKELLNDVINDLIDTIFHRNVKKIWNAWTEDNSSKNWEYIQGIQNVWKEIINPDKPSDLWNSLSAQYPDIVPLINWFIWLQINDIWLFAQDGKKSKKTLYDIFLLPIILEKPTLFDNTNTSLTVEVLEKLRESFKENLLQSFHHYINDKHKFNLSLSEVEDRVADDAKQPDLIKKWGPSLCSTVNLMQSCLHTLEISTALPNHKDRGGLTLIMSILVNPDWFERCQESMFALVDTDLMKIYRTKQRKYFLENHNIAISMKIVNRKKKIDSVQLINNPVPIINTTNNLPIANKSNTLSYYEKIRKRWIWRISSHYILTDLDYEKKFLEFISRWIYGHSKLRCRTMRWDLTLLYAALNKEVAKIPNLMIANVSSNDISKIYVASKKYHDNMLSADSKDRDIAEKFFKDVDVLVITDAEYFLSGKAKGTREYLIDQFKGTVIFVSNESHQSLLPELCNLIQKVALNAIDVPPVDKKSALKMFDSALKEYNSEMPMFKADVDIPSWFKKILVSFLPVSVAKYKEVIGWIALRAHPIETQEEQLVVVANFLNALMKPVFTFDEVAALVENAILLGDESRRNDFKEAFPQYLYAVMKDRKNTYSTFPLYYWTDAILTKLIKDKYHVRTIDTSALDKHKEEDIQIVIEDAIKDKVKKAMEL